LLERGTYDPFLIAVCYRLPFAGVARLANSILREKHGDAVATIPETLREYLMVAAEFQAFAQPPLSKWQQLVRRVKTFFALVWQGLKP
jgi:hypothetical protein